MSLTCDWFLWSFWFLVLSFVFLFSVRFPRNVDCFFWFSLLSVPAELSIIENNWARFGNLICILFYFVRLWVLLSSKDLWMNRFNGSLLRHVITIQVLFPIGLQPFPQFFTDLLLFFFALWSHLHFEGRDYKLDLMSLTCDWFLWSFWFLVLSFVFLSRRDCYEVWTSCLVSDALGTTQVSDRPKVDTTEFRILIC